MARQIRYILQGASIHARSINTLELDSELLNLDQGFKTRSAGHHLKGCKKLNLEIYWKTLNSYRKFHFIGNFKVTQCFVTVVEPHFKWLEVHIRIQGMAGKQCIFCPQGKKRVAFF